MWGGLTLETAVFSGTSDGSLEHRVCARQEHMSVKKSII